MNLDVDKHLILLQKKVDALEVTVGQLGSQLSILQALNMGLLVNHQNEVEIRNKDLSAAMQILITKLMSSTRSGSVNSDIPTNANLST